MGLQFDLGLLFSFWTSAMIRWAPSNLSLGFSNNKFRLPLSHLGCHFLTWATHKLFMGHLFKIIISNPTLTFRKHRSIKYAFRIGVAVRTTRFFKKRERRIGTSILNETQQLIMGSLYFILGSSKRAEQFFFKPYSFWAPTVFWDPIKSDF